MKNELHILLSKLLKKSEQIEEEQKKNSSLSELTYRQLHCLELIDKLQNPTLTELAENLMITKPSTTAMIDKLAEKGYVRKVKSDTDRRSAHLHLTDHGEEAGALHEKVHIKFAKLLTKNLSDSEIDILNVLLKKALRVFD